LKIRVLWFGKSSADAFAEQVATYRSRVHRRWPAEDRSLRPVAGGRDGDPRRVLAAEADLVRRHIESGWRFVALDERGDRLTSVEFARWLGSVHDDGLPGLVFVIGSDLGLDQRLSAAAARRISLSDLTLPHQIARLVLWEQLFRASSILGGGGYHRLGVQ
jgi:23S rRNA (pseudouridine1915-N3)-methyltransferase